MSTSQKASLTSFYRKIIVHLKDGNISTDIDGTVICRLTIDKRVSGPWLCPLKYFITSWNRRGKFHQHFTCSFCVRRSKKRKNVCQVISVFLHFWDLNTLNMLVECWWNSPRSQFHQQFAHKFFVDTHGWPGSVIGYLCDLKLIPVGFLKNKWKCLQINCIKKI